jgi:phosphoserine aminotransferase
MKKHNFNAGPSILPRVAVENTAKAILDLNGIGMSILEISHRTKDFQAIIDETVALFKELLNIPEGYHVLFLGGGASLQFAMVPFNLMKSKAAYLETGAWAQKAIKEAKMVGEVVVVGSSADKNFTYIPKGYTIPADADYFHITTNNTIFGSEIHTDLDSPVPLVADMSSDILSRPIDISKYALIYGGAQKNLGPAGVTFVIIREDILGKVERKIPTMLNYATHIQGRLAVQHASVREHLYLHGDPPLDQGPRRRCQDPRDEPGQGQPSLQHHRQQQNVHRHRGQGRPLPDEHLLRDERTV